MKRRGPAASLSPQSLPPLDHSHKLATAAHTSFANNTTEVIGSGNADPVDYSQLFDPAVELAASQSMVFNGLYNMYDDLRDVTNADSFAALEEVNLGAWLKSYHDELSNYSSVSIYAEVKLKEVCLIKDLSITFDVVFYLLNVQTDTHCQFVCTDAKAMRMDPDSQPSTFRVGVCADIFYKVTALFGRYKQLMLTIGNELCASIYSDYAPGKSPFSMTPYFVANKTLSERLEQLEADVAAASDMTKFYERQSETVTKAVDICAARTNRNCIKVHFLAWATACTSAADRLQQIVQNWQDKKKERRRAEAAFNFWARQILELKLTKTEDALSELRLASEAELTGLRDSLTGLEGKLGMSLSVGTQRDRERQLMMQQFREPGMLQSLGTRRRESVADLIESLDMIGHLDDPLRESLQKVLLDIEARDRANSAAGVAAAEAERLRQELEAAELERRAEAERRRKQAADARQAELDKARARARADVGEDFVVRRVRALLWRAEVLLNGPMGMNRANKIELEGAEKLPELTSVYATTPLANEQPSPYLEALLRSDEVSVTELLSLPAEALIERWLAWLLRAGNLESQAKAVERNGLQVDQNTLVALVGLLDPDGHSWLPEGNQSADGSRRAVTLGSMVAKKSPSDVAETLSAAVRLLLCEAAPAATLQEDLLSGDKNATSHLLAQLFIARPALSPSPAAAKSLVDFHSKLANQLEAAKLEWAAVQERGWREDSDLAGLLAELGHLCVDAEAAPSSAELSSRSAHSAAIWPALRLKVAAFGKTMLQQMGRPDQYGLPASDVAGTPESLDMGHALLATRPVLDASDAAAAAGIHRPVPTSSTDERVLPRGLVVASAASNRDKSGFISLQSSMLSDLIPRPLKGGTEEDKEYRGLQRALLEHEHKLWRLFRHYAPPQNGDGASAMPVDAFVRFIKDCRLPPRLLGSREVSTLLPRLPGSQPGQPGVFPDIDEAGFRFDDFLEGITRLAACSFPYDEKAPAASGGWLSGSLNHLLDNHILPNAAQSDADDFRRRAAHPAVRALQTRLAPQIKIIFAHYVRSDDAGISSSTPGSLANPADAVLGPSLSLFQLVEFAQDCGLAAGGDDVTSNGGDPGLPIHEMRKIFAGAIANPSAPPAAVAISGGDDGLILHEFAEALTALAAVRFPDPFLPLDGKLAQLFSAAVLPAMKRRNVLKT
eukprot:SAG31_NODE_400_length_16240_cov_5.159098_7_plen_1186_part_00